MEPEKILATFTLILVYLIIILSLILSQEYLGIGWFHLVIFIILFLMILFSKILQNELFIKLFDQRNDPMCRT